MVIWRGLYPKVRENEKKKRKNQEIKKKDDSMGTIQGFYTKD